MAFVLGWRAIRAIKTSNGTLVGTGGALWGLIVGGLGLFILGTLSHRRDFFGSSRKCVSDMSTSQPINSYLVV